MALLITIATTSVDFARAEVYLTESDALHLICGESSLIEHDPKEIDPLLKAVLKGKRIAADPDADTAHFFLCKNPKDGKITNYALIDAEIGKHLPITYIVGISPQGGVERVEVMVFREVYGWQVREKRFTEQFKGKSSNSEFTLGKGIANVTGATLSARSMSKGLKRALFLWEHFYARINEAPPT